MALIKKTITKGMLQIGNEVDRDMLMNLLRCMHKLTNHIRRPTK